MAMARVESGMVGAYSVVQEYVGQSVTGRKTLSGYDPFIQA